MRRFALLPLLLALAACEQVTSTRPLLASGGAQPEPGLWALLEEGCAAPTSQAVQTWPECASPAWVGEGVATIILGKPVRSEFIVADGDPRIIRLAAEGPEAYGYYAFRAEGGASYRYALVWSIACPADPLDGGYVDCSVRNEDALRRLAREAVAKAPLGRAVYVGPA